MRTPEYFWFDPFNPEDRAGFYLSDGVYQAIAPDEQGRLLSRRLNLLLLLWRGVYRGLAGTWLRWATPAGELLPTEAEAARRQAEQAQRQAEQERQRADVEAAARQAAEVEIARLRALLEEKGIRS